MANANILNRISQGGVDPGPIDQYSQGQARQQNVDASRQATQQNALNFQNQQQDRQTALAKQEQEKRLQPIREDLAAFLMTPDEHKQQVWGSGLAAHYNLDPQKPWQEQVLPFVQQNPGILGPDVTGKVLDKYFAPQKSEAYTLNQGDRRFSGDNKLVASGAPPKADPNAAFMGGAVSNPGVQGDEYLKSLQPAQAVQVKALAEGRMAFPSGFALKSPYWQSMLSAVAQYDPSFDAVNYNKRSQTANAFSKGKQADALRAVNQTISHMGNLSDTIGSLDNAAVPMLTKPVNAVINYARESSGTNSDPGKFRQQVQAISSELRKVFAGSGGGSLAELDQWEQSMPLNASKKQQTDYLHSGVTLLQGAIDALDNQYKTGMGTTSSIMDSASLISPKAKSVLTKLRGGAQPAPGAQPTPQGGIPQGWTVTPHQ